MTDFDKQWTEYQEYQREYKHVSARARCSCNPLQLYAYLRVFHSLPAHPLGSDKSPKRPTIRRSTSGWRCFSSVSRISSRRYVLSHCARIMQSRGRRRSAAEYMHGRDCTHAYRCPRTRRLSLKRWCGCMHARTRCTKASAESLTVVWDIDAQEQFPFKTFREAGPEDRILRTVYKQLGELKQIRKEARSEYACLATGRREL
jgi:hypothetical protein